MLVLMSDDTQPPGVHWSVLAAKGINERLSDLGWSQSDLVRESGVSATTIRWLQNGDHRTYRDQTLARVSKALGWPPGALRRLLLEGTKPPEPASDRLGGHALADRWRPDSGPLPAALTGKLSELTADELAKLDAYIDGLLQGRN